VTQSEVDQRLQEYMGYYANGTPTPAVTPTSYLTPTFSLTQQKILATTTPTEILATSTVTPTIALTSTPTP